MRKKKIKVGDIFYENFGLAVFYQVIKVYESGRVRIRRIESEEQETDCFYIFLATPIPNKFRPKEDAPHIKDNDKGAVKQVFYNEYMNNSPYINIYDGTWGGSAYLYENEPVNSSYYYAWVK
jgi:hypothetical protein